MVEVRKIKNKTGEILTTKAGVEMEELRLEKGDEFIGLYNKVHEKVREAEVRGNMQKISNYSLKCKIRSNGEIFKYKDSEEVFIVLTPTQANSLKELQKEGYDITQNLLSAYEYTSKTYGKQIGVGLAKKFKAPKTFDELDSEEVAEQVVKEKPVEAPVEQSGNVEELSPDNEFAKQ